jgi:preprotein translocase subunit SecE
MTALNTTAGNVPPENDVKPLGLARWVMTAFMVLAAILFWLLDKIGNAVWQMFSEPNDVLVTVGAAVASTVITFGLYRNEKINQVSYDVLGELMKVTWPSRRETQAATIVVIVASIIAAVIVGLLDAAWAQLTDLIY